MSAEANSWRMALPRRLAARVAAELSEGESIVWVGQPGPRLSLPAAYWFRLLIVFGLTAGCVVGALYVDDGVWRIVLWVHAWIFGVLLVVGVFLPALWRTGVVRRNYYYVLTNRRALICSRRPYTLRVDLRSWTAADLSRMECVERDDGSGDLRFGGDPNSLALRDGFMMIDQVRDVEKLVRETLRV